MDADQDGGPFQRRTQHPSVIQGHSGDHDGLAAVGITPVGRRISVGVLSDDVLLIMFGFYREASSLRWHRLAHVCQRWRRIVFSSPRSLRLCLFCTPSTPVRRTIDCWPPLPLILRFGSWPPCLIPEGDDNVVATLKHHDRIRSIELFLTNSLVEKLNAHVKEPFSELTELFLKSETYNLKPLTLPEPRHWSTHLRILRLERSLLPSLPVLLFDSPNLVRLELHDLPVSSWFPSPGVLAHALAGMHRLEELSIQFFPASYLLPPLPIPSKRPVLPALAKLHFHGVVKYLEDLVAGIDVPCLGKFSATFVYIFDSQIDRLSQLWQFLSRTGAHRSHTRAEIQIFDDYVSIVFNLSAHESPSHFILIIHRIGLYNQLSTMTIVCNHLPASFLGLEDLGVVTSCRPESVDGENWIRLLRPFRDVARFHLVGEFAKPIMHALQQAEEESETVLPSLRELSIEMEPVPHCDWEPLWPAVRSFTTLRQLSGRPVNVAYGKIPCQCDQECE